MFIVGIGGTLRQGSSSESALRIALEPVVEAGHEVKVFAGTDLTLPLYDPDTEERTLQAVEFVNAVRAADGFVLSSPGYHGTISGLLKNALDYIEDLAREVPCYVENKPVGTIGVAYGWQAAVNTVQALRDIVHALRGWPTPYGAAINAIESRLNDGHTDDEAVAVRLRMIGQQVVGFVEMRQSVAAAR